MKTRTSRLVAALALAGACAPAQAAAPDIGFEWNLRARWEHVDDDAFADRADAATVRARAGLRAAFAPRWSGLLEVEAIGALDDAYDSGANGRTTLPAVIDPEGVELNQAWLARKGERTLVRAGRQRLAWDNQRWLGAVGWRQNEQTFDALLVEHALAKEWTLRYAGLARVHRVAGDDARDPRARERELASHFVNLAHAGPRRQWSAYAYLHDDRDVAAAATATWGVRWHGDTANAARRWGATLELARQVDHAGNPRDFSHAYWLVEPSLSLGPTTWRLGREHLGGDGTHALQTPLATLHAFNGWADRLTTTPPHGLDDTYAAAGGKFGEGGRFTWSVAWHEYRADAGDARYGTEWNASFGFPAGRRVDGLVKLADYRAEGFARDTTKLWLQFEWAGSTE